VGNELILERFYQKGLGISQEKPAEMADIADNYIALI
jgi:predicted transcriptional regulator